MALLRQWLIAATLLSSCAVTIPEGRFRCAVDGDCPDGWFCADSVCSSTRPDAGRTDASFDAAVTSPDATVPVDGVVPVDTTCSFSRVGVNRSSRRSAAGGTEYRYDLGAPCCGFEADQTNAFYLATEPGEGLAPVWLCVHSSGRTFLSDAACESSGWIPETRLGWMATGERCGAVPLYRLVTEPATVAGHLFTADPDERDAALASGYVIEIVAGFVWRE